MLCGSAKAPIAVGVVGVVVNGNVDVGEDRGRGRCCTYTL